MTEKEKARKRAEFDVKMTEIYGPDWQSISIQGPLGTVRFSEAYAEMGIEQITVSKDSSQGLWQMPPTKYRCNGSLLPPGENKKR